MTYLIANVGILVNRYQETKLYGPVGLVNVISKFYLTIMIIAALNTECWTNVAGVIAPMKHHILHSRRPRLAV